MRLATITNWAYGATVCLTLLSGVTMLMASSAQERERASVSQRYALDQATTTIEDDVVALSELARQYAVRGDAPSFMAYQRTRLALGPVETRTKHIQDAGATADELRSLHEAISWADALQVQQQEAIEARQRGAQIAAMQILFAPEYERELDRSRAAVERFQYHLDQRTAEELGTAEHTARLWRTMSEAMLALTGLLFLCVLYFVFRRRVLHPVVKLSDVIGRLAAQDYAAEPPQFERVDEIGDMAQALSVFRENGIERQRLERERDTDRAVRDLLSRMTQRLQGCDTVAELTDVVSRFAPEVAPRLSGVLFLLDPARGILRQQCSWQMPVHSVSEFPMSACWALRRSAPHRPSGSNFDMPCSHLVGPALPDSICLPLTGQHGTLGLLYLEQQDNSADVALNHTYLDMLAENIGLALDNLRLREALQSLAMVDPLTTLPNRRQLDEVLARELAESEQNGTPVCCAMIDIDHFKRFNDQHGHDAGDVVLRAVGKVLIESVRDKNLVFRYGGEEFLMLMPGMELAAAEARAEEIRSQVASLRVRYEGGDLGQITASIGLACAPLHTERRTLVQTADAALLRAKQAGRNRVLIATARASVAVAEVVGAPVA